MVPLGARTFTLALALSLVAAGSAAAVTPRRRAAIASSYVVSQQQDDGSVPSFSTLAGTADAVLSLVAARRAPEAIGAALDYLEQHAAEADSIGEVAKLVQAAVAGGRDPRDFGGRDLVATIAGSEQVDGRYGASTEVFNHASAILALVAAGEDPSDAALSWLVNAQCPDGGWQFDRPWAEDEDSHCFTGDAENDFFRSDTNATSLAVQAIDAAGFTGFEYRKSPFRFFRATRDEVKDGWPYTPGFVTDSNSTSLVIQAYVAAGRDLPGGARAALRALQYRLCGPRAGAFAFTWEETDNGYRKTPPDAGATVGAIPGLVEMPFPILHFNVTRPAPAASAC